MTSSLRWPSALLALALGCTSSAHTTSPAPVTEPTVSTTMAEVDAGAPMAEPDAGAVAAAEDVPPAEAPLPPMPEGLHGPARPWARMSDRERAQYMGQAVMPAMTALLQAYDPTRFATVTCATCHGANARAVHFHMPNALPALPDFGTPASQQRMAAEHRMFEFMGTRVTPAMAQILGVERFNPQTHQGFGCFSCHPHEGAAAPAAH